MVWTHSSSCYRSIDAEELVDDPRLPIHLLVFATQTAITTSTCIADYMSWSSFSSNEKVELGKLYVPYMALCKSQVLGRV